MFLKQRKQVWALSCLSASINRKGTVGCLSQLAPPKTFCYNAAHFVSKDTDIGGGN